jgi:predicted nucleotidyltransferase
VKPDPPEAHVDTAAARAWIGALPPVVAPLAAVLFRLLEAAEADPRIRALQVRGSIARGTADAHSDLDTLLRVDDDRYEAALADLPSLARSLGPALDVLFETPGSPYLFVQFADRVQLELAARRASEASGLAAGVVVLLDRDGLLARPYEPEPAWDRGLWLGWAWMALSAVDKYLRRDSLWEALTALEKARSLLLRHHAATSGVSDPELGLTSILDFGAALPERLEETVAPLDAEAIRRAAHACAEILATYERRPFGDLVLARLAPGS